MKKHDLPGLFIVFEGIDGSGKTTQIKKVEEFLINKDLSVTRLYEPTHGEYGKKLRDLFSKGHVIPIEEEIELSVKDRTIDVEQNILPALKEGKIVLLDRYYWSNVAYQGIVDENYSMEYILEKSRNFPTPDILFYFDIEVEDSIQRISSKRKPNEYESFNELTKSKHKYNELIENIPNSFSGAFITINAGKPEDEVFFQLTENIMEFLSNQHYIH